MVEHTVVGVAWYRRDQWERLRSLASDRDHLAATYDEWLGRAEARFRELTARGFRLRRVDVDVEMLWAWCCANFRALDGSARAEWVADLARQLEGDVGDA